MATGTCEQHPFSTASVFAWEGHRLPRPSDPDGKTARLRCVLEVTSMNLRDLPLGSLIVRDGIARAATVRDALVEAQETDRRLGEVMLDRGWIRERDLARLLAEQEKLEFVDLARIDLDERAVDCLPESVARRVQAIGFGFANSVLLVAVSDPTDDRGLDQIREAAGRRVRFKVALQSEIDAALSDAYGDPLVASA